MTNTTHTRFTHTELDRALRAAAETVGLTTGHTRERLSIDQDADGEITIMAIYTTRTEDTDNTAGPSL